MFLTKLEVFDLLPAYPVSRIYKAIFGHLDARCLGLLVVSRPTGHLNNQTSTVEHFCIKSMYTMNSSVIQFCTVRVAFASSYTDVYNINR